MKPNIIILGVIVAIVVIFATAILSSTFTLVALGSMINSGAVEEMIVVGLQEEMSGLTVDCNSSYVEQAAVLKFNGTILYCRISQNPKGDFEKP